MSSWNLTHLKYISQNPIFLDTKSTECFPCSGTYQGQWLRGMRHGYGVRTSAAFGIASHSRGGDGARRPSVSSLQPGVEEPKPSSAMSNGSGHGGPGAKDNAELRGGFVLKSRSDEAPVRRRSLVERTGMKNLMQVATSQRKSDIVLQ